MSANPNSVSAAPANAASQAAARRWLTPVELVALAAIWGASFLFMRVAAKDFGAVALVEVRLALGALVLLPFLWQARNRFTSSFLWRLAGIAIINSAMPFMLFAWAAQRAPAGIGAITNALAVVFTAVVAALFFGERINSRQAVGLCTGFVGVVVLASGKTAGEAIWPAALAGTFAALLYGFGGNLVRRQLGGLPPSAVAAATLVSASLLLAPFAFMTWPRAPIPALSWICGVALGVLCTGIAYLLYFRLIARIGAPRAATVTYLIPLFAVVWAWLLLGEPLTLSMAIAGALILGGVGLSQHKR